MGRKHPTACILPATIPCAFPCHISKAKTAQTHADEVQNLNEAYDSRLVG